MIYSIYVQHNITFLTKQKITHTKNRKSFSVSQRKKNSQKWVPKISYKNASEYKLLILTARINVNLHIKYVFKVNIN